MVRGPAGRGFSSIPPGNSSVGAEYRKFGLSLAVVAATTADTGWEKEAYTMLTSSVAAVTSRRSYWSSASTFIPSSSESSDSPVAKP
ncbi:hypothetical protein CYMTET_46382 [Cymbomonas tetramitiformis]|uniref:Uncharacterized protein n=1 Tax=Cymbomonas tetramitiformis TaxID=36881 RepID=A0AAE0BXG9_9CHLO|nr:hypothetical protein CYMTET_46382 [Cymbomonas tetramitiformis]